MYECVIVQHLKYVKYSPVAYINNCLCTVVIFKKRSGTLYKCNAYANEVESSTHYL